MGSLEAPVVGMGALVTGRYPGHSQTRTQLMSIFLQKQKS
jgi:hypothetical protein